MTTSQLITAQPSITRTPQALRDAMAAVAAIDMGRIPLQQSAVLHDTPVVLDATWTEMAARVRGRPQRDDHARRRRQERSN
ncbi:hypothetical protein OIE52_48175 [Streptomyces canus]|uniref:hypothetical protein n=1 Tax=Streptomyces canus TaxID=58343 RepID=UPI002E28911A|nr:hypothetical protein [Streptomyces canus]